MSTYNTFKKPLAGQQNKPTHHHDIEEARTHSGVYESVFGTPVQELDVKERMQFIRKLYVIVASQLATSVLLSCLFIYVKPLSALVPEGIWNWAIPFGFIVACTVASAYVLWSQHRDLSWRARYSLLVVFTVLEGAATCDLLSKFHFEYGLLVLILTLAATLSMIGFTFQIKYDFENYAPFVVVYATTALLVIPSVLLFRHLDFGAVLGACLLSALASTYVILELYFLMRDLTQSDYILGSTHLFIDLAYPIRCLHHLCELSDGVQFGRLGNDDDDD